MTNEPLMRTEPSTRQSGQDDEALMTTEPPDEESERAERSLHDDDGPVIPDRSADDDDAGWGENVGWRDDETSDDERLQRERPPHW